MNTGIESILGVKFTNDGLVKKIRVRPEAKQEALLTLRYTTGDEIERLRKKLLIFAECEHREEQNEICFEVRRQNGHERSVQLLFTPTTLYVLTNAEYVERTVSVEEQTRLDSVPPASEPRTTTTTTTTTTRTTRRPRRPGTPEQRAYWREMGRRRRERLEREREELEARARGENRESTTTTEYSRYERRTTSAARS